MAPTPHAVFPADSLWKKKLLAYGQKHFPFLAYFNDWEIPYPYGGFKEQFLAASNAFSFDEIDTFPGEKAGILSYDLKNRFEKLKSENHPCLENPEAVFFKPEIKVTFPSGSIRIESDEPEAFFRAVKDFDLEPVTLKTSAPLCLTDRETYKQKVRAIQQNIEEGDIYELNYCIGFEAEVMQLDPAALYWALGGISPMPFSCFFKAGQQFLIGASPERFLKKKKDLLIAQPIKGTIKRGLSEAEDLALQQTLMHSEKERAENLMIVDLMRNDLSKVSQVGSVKVKELFGVYPFKKVSQMISTVTSILKPEATFENIIAHTFPMGSMTGAPKIKCMELIEHYEQFKRGWFSGSVGHVDENGDFDFNVVIRSLVYDAEKQKLFFAVGSAITHDADPDYEYEECLLKAAPILELLGRGWE
ncbi:anthranilate synthase component I family protein [Pararhodonellum marinum]|uniref:anthranilate synthase component I family protein n=1 Tax=Pararhodonellum marinum TaxID=2755358 RepID=UPI00188FE62B|nr:anthranilate synthase component I family protein [Pararhodonellum marinum]